MKKSLPYDAYEELADSYAELIDTKPHNAYYDRPAVQSLIDNISGQTVLDAGCGPGIYTEWLIKKGATVIAIDSSEKMLSYARKRNEDRATFYQANMAEPLDFLEDNTFDGIVSALAITYIENHTLLFKQFNRILRPNGWFVFSTEHPFFSYQYFKVGNYFETKQVSCEWVGFSKKVRMPSYYHCLGSITDSLTNNDFIIERVLEPKPTPEFKSADPDDYNKFMKFPLFICIKARKKEYIERTKNTSHRNQTLKEQKN